MALQSYFSVIRGGPAWWGEQSSTEVDVFQHSVRSSQAEVGLVGRQTRKLAPKLLARGLVEAVQHDGRTLRTPLMQPFDRGAVAFESVAVL